MTKLYILAALSKAESVHGQGFSGKLDTGDVSAGKSLANDGLVSLGRVAPPGLGTTVSLTEEGRTAVRNMLERAAGHEGPAGG